MSIEEAANEIAAKYQSGGEKGSKTAVTANNPFAMFVDSVVSAIGPEMLGHEPSAGVEAFREKNPVSGFASQLIGIATPYGAVGAASKLPKVAGILDKVGDANTIIGGAKRNAALFGAGVEAPRIAGAVLTGGDVGETAANAGINTALELGFGGLGGYFRAAGKVDKKLAKLGSTVDLKQAPQTISQDLLKAMETGKVAESDLPYAKNMLANLDEAIRTETLSGDNMEKYVKELLDGDAQPLNRLFKYSATPQKSPIVKKRLLASDFDTPQELDSVLSSSGLKDNIAYVQFPRFLSSADESGAKAIEASLKQGGMRSVGENTFLGKEKSGLYIMAKKLEGDIGRPGTGDKWVMFKTSNPGKFSKTSQKWGDQIADRNAWMVEAKYTPKPDAPLDIFDEASQLADAMPIHGFYQATTGLGGKGLAKLEKMVGLEGESEALRRLKVMFRENFAPAMYEFRSNPRAQWAFAQAKTAFQKAESMAHALTYGDEALGKGANLYSKLLANASLSGKFGTKTSFAKILEPLDQAQIDELVSAVDRGLEGKALVEAHAKGNISKPVFDALNQIQPLDDYLIAQTKGTMEAVGSTKNFSPIKGHYMLPRTWKGTWRVPLKNEQGRLIYMASGTTRQEAITQAEKILAQEEAKGWKAMEAMTADSTDDVALALQVAAGSPEYMTAASLKNRLMREAGSPKSFKVRTGVGGYESAFTKEELIKKFYDNTLARNRHIAEMTTNKLLGDQIARVGLEDAVLMKELQRRIDAMAGKTGAVNKLVNAEVDKVFAPSLGKNSASKIAGTINEVNHHLTLGALNVAYPTMNMLTFIQTVMPRVAFTINATDESVAKAYSFSPLLSGGKVKGSMGVLSPLKIMGQSFKEMGKPSEALSKNFAKALREGVVDPKFVEEWAGQNSKQVLNLKAVLTGEEGFSTFLKSISNYLPSQSEKLARGNAFTVGHILGRDFFKLEDEALYRFAKEFTEKTMYNYSAADRPRVFTGPLGSVFGQFKTWTSHYIANMLEYAGEGFNYGNWSPFLWQLGGTTALGGVSATALYPVAETFNGWLSDKTLMENIYARFGGGSGDDLTGNLADGIMHGLPMFMGVSVSGQASDPFSDPSRTASMLFSFVQMQRAQALSKALGQAVDNYAITGEHPVNSQETRDLLIAAVAPKMLARSAAITEDQALKSLNNGSKLYGGLNVAERLMYQAGFMPKRIALQKDVNEELWKSQTELKAKVSSYGRLWSEAEREKDWELLTQLQQRALAEGVPLDSIIRSAKTRTKNATEPQMDRKFKPEEVMRFQSLGIVE